MNQPENLNVMVFGGAGAREHALIQMAGKSPLVNEVHCVASNAGIDQTPNVIVAEKPDNFDRIAIYCSENEIDLVIIGPEAPLAEGLADMLRASNIPTFGPGAAAAKLEASKSWAVEFMQRHGIPTADTTVHNSLAKASHGLMSRRAWPVVVKYDGLMGGKGVTICHSTKETHAALEKLYNNEPDAVVLLQEYLPDNPQMVRSEISVHAIVSGDGSYQILPTAQDYKPRFDKDDGPMTGGMGCFGPVPEVDMDRIETEIVKPTIEGLRQDGIDYRGVIYFGLKLCPDGPMVVEYNVRFGDPEMVILSELVTSDIVPLIWAAANSNDVSEVGVEVFDGSAVGTVIVNKAYPGKGKACEFPEGLNSPSTYHAATYQNGKSIVADGGRIAVVTRRRHSIAAARNAVYKHIDQVNLGGLDCRRDIAAGM